MAENRYHYAVALAAGNIYSIGGINQTAALTSVERYNTATKTWTSSTPLPIARYTHGKNIFESLYLVD